MIGILPDFFNSPYFIITESGWALKPNAPQEVIDQFNAYFSARKQTEKELEEFSEQSK